MKRSIFIGILSIFLLANCQTEKSTNTSSEDAPMSNFKEVSAKEFSERISKEKGIVLDVRSPEEFEEEHLKNAQNIDINGEIFDKKLGSLDKKSTYFVYCLKGKRSSKALEKMKQQGFQKAYEMQGGLTSWKKEGLEVVR
jgi:rhodanese-related sulfurtransferase